VNDADLALYYHAEFGPTFGRNDIVIYVQDDNNSKEYDYCECMQTDYEKKIRETEGLFLVKDYEVFQIMKKIFNVLYMYGLN
jgi:hypothetical protein